MSLQSVAAALAEVAGEVDGVVSWWPSPRSGVDASECPAVMPLPGSGQQVSGDLPATSRPQQHAVRLWLLVAPDTHDYAEAMAALSALVSPVMDHLTQSWARTPRHPLLQRIRRIESITYETATGLSVPPTFFGAEFVVTVTEETRVQ